MLGRRILVIEDDRKTAAAIRLYLEPVDDDETFPEDAEFLDIAI